MSTALLEAARELRTELEDRVDDPGHIVFLEGAQVLGRVYVGWALVGGVQRLRDHVERMSAGAAFLGSAVCTFDEYVAWTRDQRDAHVGGRWFYRSPRFQNAFDLIFAQETDDGEPDHQVD